MFRQQVERPVLRSYALWTCLMCCMIVCREPPDAGLMCECLWSDPAPEQGRQVRQAHKQTGRLGRSNAGSSMSFQIHVSSTCIHRIVVWLSSCRFGMCIQQLALDWASAGNCIWVVNSEVLSVVGIMPPLSMYAGKQAWRWSAVWS